MSGHSKWSTIKRKKGAADAKRGKVFTQLIRELTIAARLGGGDVASNPRLRLAISNARTQNMPNQNIERAIKKGTGEIEGEAYDEVRYEGYGPNGVAIMLDTLTDNRNRTVSRIRHAFGKHGGNLGSNGCVSYLFEQKGILQFRLESIDGDALMERAIEADALDVSEDGSTVEVQTRFEDFDSIKRRLAEDGFTPVHSEITMVAQSTVQLRGDGASRMLRLYEILDEHEDVKQVYSNFDISEEEMLRAAQS